MSDASSMTPTFLERMSKWTVLASAFAAIACGTWLGARAWAPLLPLSIAAFVGTCALGKWQGTRVWAPVMVFAYILPAVLLLLHGYDDPAYWNLWMAGLLGGAFGTTDLRGWSFPARWKWPLIYWALAVALAWPVVVAREADFTWSMLSRYNLALSSLGGPPPVIAVFVLGVALTHLIGLLWLDAAFVAFPFSRRAESLTRFSRDVLWPLVVSLIVGSLVAIYQGAVDITWLSEHQYVILHRATASLNDGNAFGAVAGFWIGGVVALAMAARRQWVRVAAAVSAAIAGAGLWATGSRMALLAAIICVGFALWHVATLRKWSLRNILRVTVPVIALIVVFDVAAARRSMLTPLDRVMMSLPEPTADGLKTFVTHEFWNRYGPYGTVSMKLVRDFPLSGIGLGSFNHIFPDESFALTRDRAHKDNAQSWYRHQLAELGVLGSLGWLIWLPMFVVTLVRTRGDEGLQFPATMVKASLVAVGVVSIVSMPTQSIPVAFTVWVLIYWYMLLSTEAGAAAEQPGVWTRTSYKGAIVWTLALVFVLATGWSGWRSLRPPFRAIRAEWTYQVGFVETTPEDLAAKIRWTERHAVEVLPIGGRWLKLTVRGGPPDIATHTVRLEVRRLGRTIIAVTLPDTAEQTWYVKAPEGAARMMLEFDVNRTWRPSDFSGTDTRQLGVAVSDWTFVQDVPRNAVVIQ